MLSSWELLHANAFSELLKTMKIMKDMKIVDSKINFNLHALHVLHGETPNPTKRISWRCIEVFGDPSPTAQTPPRNRERT
jgi:hypothetical protein